MYRQDYLSHHGIKGQKWGRRRYSIDVGNSEKKTSPKKDDEEVKEENNEPSNSVKKPPLPNRFSKWFAFGDKHVRRARSQRLKRSSTETIRRTNKIVNDLSSQYSIVYDPDSKSYSWKKKQTNT